jgi:PelA/Pel-15E family pectate lyase
MNGLLRWFIVLVVSIFLASDRQTARGQETQVFPGEHWESKQPAEVGLNGELLNRFAVNVGGDGCIIRDGYLVTSWGDMTRHKDWASAAKPVLSTLLLLAVQEKRIASVDARVQDLGWALTAKDASMTFRHLANMVSGYGLSEKPGEAWGYNDFAIQLYAQSLEKVFGDSLERVLHDRMEAVQFEDGEFFGSRDGTGVTASSRDFARLGWLWLNRGKWKNTQVLDQKLFDACFRVGVPVGTPRAVSQTDDYLKIDSYGGGTNQTASGPGVYGFNLWFNTVLESGERVWPALPADAYQANGLWNRDTLTVIPSWRMVIASRGAQPGKFEPGAVRSQYNQNLQLITQAVGETSFRDGTEENRGERRQSSLWRPIDFPYGYRGDLENPFRVQFSATVTRPDGSQFEIPGFYEGDGLWKVRISSDVEGSWSLETHSDQPQLAGQRAEWTCLPNGNPRLHGKVLVDAQHPYHFIHEDGSRFFMLGYECDWLWSLDTQDPKLETVNRFLDSLLRSGFNYVILNTFAQDTSWRPGKSGEDDFGPPPMYAWEGTNEAPDHSRLNVDYWRHYDRVMQAMADRGIVAHVMLKVYNKKVNWPERASADDDLFFRSMVARYAAFPNVIWDFSKEAHNEKDTDYKLGRLKLVRELDPYKHLITTHDDTANYDAGVFDDTNDFRCDQQHSDFREFILAQRKQRSWPVANVEFGYEQGLKGPDDKTYRITHTPEELVRRAWEISMAGGYTAYYYTYTAWDVLRPDDQPLGYNYFHLLRQFIESTRYWELSPLDRVVSSGWVLGNPGLEYVVYPQSGDEFELTLPAGPSGYIGEWFNVHSGERVAAQLTTGAQKIKSPMWKGPAVLHIVATSADKSAAVEEPQLVPIDLSDFGSGIGHWRNLRDESRFIQVEKDQPAYAATQVREIVENILLFQRANGGWPKDYDMTAILTPQQRERVVATHENEDTSYDNDNIFSQVNYLAQAVHQAEDPAWRAACERGLDFILRSQYANGGFPQRFPRPHSYHAHITFNDGVMIGALQVLKDAAEHADYFQWLDNARRQQASKGVERGIDCILRCQIRVDGQLTGWCQQHDEVSFEARPARTFELASICPQETAQIARFLMSQPLPSTEVKQAVDAAVAWLRQTGIAGIRIEKVKSTPESFLRHDTDIDVVVVEDPAAELMWARHYEIGTNRPVFAGRDGIKKYALAEIERERRTGTPWYGSWPRKLIAEEYDNWKRSFTEQ